MLHDSSPPPLSDDSAVGSSSSIANNDRVHHQTLPQTTTTISTTPNIPPPSQQQSQQHLNNLVCPQQQQQHQLQQQQQQEQRSIRITRPSARDLQPVGRDELVLAARLMRQNNCSLILKSIRTNLPCFDDLDIQKFESNTSFLINFISNGINDCSATILRPVSIKWPDTYDRMVDQLATLDVFLLNTGFREKPVDWMLNRGLIRTPCCQHCKEKMVIKNETGTVRWFCNKTPICGNYYMPIQRPSFFYSFEDVGLDKLLFAVYYWSTCTPGEELFGRMNIQPEVLNSLWKKLQNVCRTALDKSYPRHRLTNQLDEDYNPVIDQPRPAEPIDLISIKLNNVYVVCAKHPASNLVRLGLYIPKVSQYSFADLTASWFAHGANIRISEAKFLELNGNRSDLKIEVVPRSHMMTKNGRFYRDSAFGYIVCQLSHILKDSDSSTLPRESLKLILAELEWRELYGPTPSQAFTSIVDHMVQYGEASDWYSEPSLPVAGEVSSHSIKDRTAQVLDICDYIWAERYFYATVDPVDKDGKIIQRYIEPPSLENPPMPDIRMQCHECNLRFDCFDFTIHMTTHVERNRREAEQREYLKKDLIECKHCFKIFKRQDIELHSRLFASHYHQCRYGCRICCIHLRDRAQYLQHMRAFHFEHETPYRCPSCKFASSFQRDVFIHFQEEHRHSMILLCPLCLRGFTVAKPELITPERMNQLSKFIYNHVAEHYVTSKAFTCNKCSLCFIDKEALDRHRTVSHNPVEVRSSPDVKLSPFIVNREEEEFCVKALPQELFISCKRPNLLSLSDRREEDDNNSEASKKEKDDAQSEREPQLPLQVSLRPAIGRKSLVDGDCSSGKLIEYLSRMKRADGIIPNRSVLLTPNLKPAKCCECCEFITVDHFVNAITCKRCKHVTYCPIAATKHKKTKHPDHQEG